MIGSTYKHFKGNIVKILNIGYDSETLNKVVIYQELDDDKIWVRDYNMFFSKVDKEKYPNVKQDYRFEKINA